MFIVLEGAHAFHVRLSTFARLGPLASLSVSASAFDFCRRDLSLLLPSAITRIIGRARIILIWDARSLRTPKKAARERSPELQID